MTDREWRATRCVECYGTDRDAELYTACGCQQIPCGGTIYSAQCETIGVRKTAPDECANTPEGLTNPTVEESKWL